MLAGVGVFGRRLGVLAAAAVLGVALLCTAAIQAKADEALHGVALVIGQSAYRSLHALPNPANDARAVSRLLEDLGFEVTDVVDADRRKLARSLDRFVEDAEEADVALVYYSGHGIEAGGENFLVPVDADIGALGDAEGRLIPVSKFLDELQAAAPVTIVLLDACRSNPFPPGAMATVEEGEAPVAVAATGLGTPRSIAPLRQAAAKAAPDGLGAVIGYAAAPGHVALDGDAGVNSPYAAALLKHLAASGFSFSDVMTMVGEEVYLKTAAQQVPWTNSSLRRTLYFGGAPEAGGDEALIRGERRKLLLKVSRLDAPERAQVAAAAKENGVPLDGLFAMLEAVGAKPTEDPEKLDRLMQEQAARLKEMVGAQAVMGAASPEIARLTGLSRQAIGEGALSAAIAFNERAKAAVAEDSTTVDEAEAQLKAKRLEFGAVFAQSARTYALSYDFRRAADDFASAFAQVERWDDAKAVEYKTAEAKALEDLGFFGGDDAALDRAADAYREAGKRAARGLPPATWAKARAGLAMTLWTRASRTGDTKALDEAAALLREALAKSEADAGPDERAAMAGDLGLVLTTQGMREPGTERLQEAAGILAQAVATADRKSNPLGWARLNGRLGQALLALGSRETSTTTLEKAAAAFRASLEERTREKVPVDWASSTNNLAIAIHTIGDRELGTEKLEEAAKLYRDALSVQTRERAPLLWAQTQTDLGTALFSLGGRGRDVESYRQAVAAFRMAAEETTAARDPLGWGALQDNIGIALSNIGAGTGDAIAIQEAIRSLEAALTVRTRQAAPLDWASTENNLGNAYYRLGDLLNDETAWGHAVTAYRAALEERRRDRVPLEWAAVQNNLGNVLYSQGKHAASVSLLRESAGAYAAALEVYRSDSDALGWARASRNLGEAQLEIGNLSFDKTILAEARRNFETARDAFRKAGQTQHEPLFQILLQQVELAELQADIQAKLKAAQQAPTP